MSKDEKPWFLFCKILDKIFLGISVRDGVLLITHGVIYNLLSHLDFEFDYLC